MWLPLLAVLILVCRAQQELLTNLTAETHDDYVRHNKNAVVFYFVPWCYWCRSFMPVFEDVVIASETTFKPLGPEEDRPAFARIDLSIKENRPILEKQDITAFPTVKLHMGYGNTTAIYNGEQSFQPLMSWLMDLTTTKVEIFSPEQLTALLKLHHSDIVCLLVNPTPSIQKAYEMVGKGSSKVMLGTAEGPRMSQHILDTYEKGKANTDSKSRIAYLRKNPNAPFLVLLNPHHYSDDPDRFTYDRSHLEYLAHIYPEQDRQDHLLEDAKAMELFIKAYQFPTISRWSADVGARLIEEQRPFLVAFRHLNASLEQHIMEGEEESFEARDTLLLHIEDVLWDVGKRFRASMSVVVSGIDRFHERRLMSTLHVEETPALVYVAQNPQGTGIYAPTLRYYAPEEITKMVFTLPNPENPAASTRVAAEKLRSWIADVQSGRVQPSIKSEDPLPDESNSGPVRMLVGLTFQKEVIQTTDDVVVDFYAPWCGHCRVLAPVYEKVARAFRKAGITKIKFAKIDATANEVAGLQLRAYPTILLYTSKAKDRPAEHMGGVHAPEELIKWVHQHSTFRFDMNRVLQALKLVDEPDDLPKLVEEL